MTKSEHDRIVRRETLFGRQIVRMFDALRLYADCHRECYESPIGEDYVIGEHWKQMASGLLGLLNGETGTLDCGTWDRNIRRLAKENGFTAEEIDSL
jgi:hypothetical protein